jgi:hypothetical protein
MLESLGQLIRNPDGNPLVQTIAKHAPTWLIQFPALVKAEQRDALQREILGATRERMVREICEALEAITSADPLLLVFEDLHWSDPSTLDLISALARRREAAKLMLLCTYRPVDVVLSNSSLKGLKQDLQVHRLCSEIALERLEEPLIAEYLATEVLRGESACRSGNGDLPSFGRERSVYGSHRPGYAEARIDRPGQRRRVEPDYTFGNHCSERAGDATTNAGGGSADLSHALIFGSHPSFLPSGSGNRRTYFLSSRLCLPTRNH